MRHLQRVGGDGMTAPRVLNVHGIGGPAGLAASYPNAVYVGHAVRFTDWPETPWGNRRRGTREEKVAAHAAYALERYAADPAWLAPLRGRDLACWCAPEPCHADLLQRLANDPAAPGHLSAEAARPRPGAPIDNPRPHWPCRKCKGRDWWQQDRPGDVLWRCGDCTPRPVDAGALLDKDDVQ